MSRLVTLISLWRIAAFPLLVGLILFRQMTTFGYLLAFSFLTDAVDGFLARRFRVTSRAGTELDSLGDDLTVVAGVIGLFVFKMDLVRDQVVIVFMLSVLFLLHTIIALARFGQLTSFHTRMAKIAAISQAVFFIQLFLLPAPADWVFFIASGLTFLDLFEEIAMSLSLEECESDIKGWWEVRRRQKKGFDDHSHSAR
ncbi:MAG TPA: CDP-alcohol phosphatidyltransferase family protein [Puia sp.]|nr:CDP-alcohol phosphatidyltransferase family protein [Puia sp.]